MDVESSKVLPELFLFLGPDVLEVLPAEDDNSSLCDQESQFVLLGIAELAQLESSNLSADSRRELSGDDVWVVGCKEVGFGLVGESAFVNDLDGLGGWEEGVVIIDREILGIFVLVSQVNKFWA